MINMGDEFAEPALAFAQSAKRYELLLVFGDDLDGLERMEDDLWLTCGGVSRSKSDTVLTLFLSEPHPLITSLWLLWMM